MRELRENGPHINLDELMGPVDPIEERIEEAMEENWVTEEARARITGAAGADAVLQEGYVHPTAVTSPTSHIDPSAQIGRYAELGKYVYVLKGVRIEDWVKLHTSAYVMDDVHIGEGSVVGAHTYIEQGATVQRGVLIGQDVSIGEGAEIMSGVVIGDDTAIPAGEVITKANYQYGWLHGYQWVAMLTMRGEPMLQFGCEEGSFAYWRENLQELCVQHKPKRAWLYEKKISALLDFLEGTLPWAT